MSTRLDMTTSKFVIMKHEADKAIEIYREGRERTKSLLAEPPRCLAIEVTNKCNLACGYCGHSTQSIKHGYINPNIIYDLEYEISQLYNFSFLGSGEPLINRKIFDIIDFVRNHNKDCNISLPTNGTFNLTDEEVYMLGKNRVLIIISLDSIDQKIQDITRPNSSVSKITKNIESIIQRKEAYGFASPKLIITSVITKNIIGNLKKFTKYLMDVGCGYHHLALLNQSIMSDKLYNELSITSQIDIESINSEIKEIHDVTKNSDCSLCGNCIRSDVTNETDRICLDPWLLGNIHVTGLLSPCLCTPERHYVGALRHKDQNIDDLTNDLMEVTNEHDTEKFNKIKLWLTNSSGSFMKAWNSHNMIRLRKEIISNKLNSTCIGCMKQNLHNSWHKC